MPNSTIAPRTIANVNAISNVIWYPAFVDTAPTCQKIRRPPGGTVPGLVGHSGKLHIAKEDVPFVELRYRRRSA